MAEENKYPEVVDTSFSDVVVSIEVDPETDSKAQDQSCHHSKIVHEKSSSGLLSRVGRGVRDAVGSAFNLGKTFVTGKHSYCSYIASLSSTCIIASYL